MVLGETSSLLTDAVSEEPPPPPPPPPQPKREIAIKISDGTLDCHGSLFMSSLLVKPSVFLDLRLKPAFIHINCQRRAMCVSS
jgi:hypothetical protein